MKITYYYKSLFLLFGALTFSFLHTPVWADNQISETPEEKLYIGNKDLPVVIELFTTKNCRACLNAEYMLYKLNKHDNVIALGCHVDHWNSDEGKDEENTSGIEECTQRQWFYSNKKNWNDEIEIQIPHFVINGKRNIIGAKDRQLRASLSSSSIRSSQHTMLWVDMEWVNPDTIRINLPENPKDKSVPYEEPYNVWFMKYKDKELRKVTDGEKDYVFKNINIVQDVRFIGKWYGEAQNIDVKVKIESERKNRGGSVVLLQLTNSSPVEGAGRLQDYDLKWLKEYEKRMLNPPENKTPEHKTNDIAQ